MTSTALYITSGEDWKQDDAHPYSRLLKSQLQVNTVDEA